MRFGRPVAALVAVGAAVTSVALAAAPASAATSARQSEWWLKTLDIRDAWLASRGAGVTVAVLSDGVDASQQDLAGSVAALPAPAGAPQATGRYLGQQGTAIASLIAGHGHGVGKRLGIIGVAPGARILSVPVTLPSDDPLLGEDAVATAIPDAIAAGIREAVSHGASVIDLPIDPGQPGASGTGGNPMAAGGTPAEQAAVAYAIKRGVVLVAPAGDNGAVTDATNYPAAYPGVIAVGAFNQAFIKAPWSSHDSYVTVTAAGWGVVAAANNGGYQTMNSTSAASAIVSGIAALIKSRYPSLSAAQVRQALISSTMFRRADGMADGSGYGVVNGYHALAAAQMLATPAADRAGAHARPLAAPAAIQPASSAKNLGPELIRYALLSVGLLVLLLLLVGWYLLIARRKARRPTQLTAEWTQRPSQSRYPQPAGADGDRRLELLSAPVGPGHNLGSPSSSSARGAASGLFAPAPSPGALGSGALGVSAAQPDAGGWLAQDPPAPPARPSAARPVVSGAPPWEPAPPPAGELPWNAAAEEATAQHSSRPWRSGTGGLGAPVVRGSRRDRVGSHALSPSADHPEEQASVTDEIGAAGDVSSTGSLGSPERRNAGRTFAVPGLDRSRPDRATARHALTRGWAEPADGGRGPAEPVPASSPGLLETTGVTASGLPIRRPQAVNSTPLSPSGSLWEPASGGPSGTDPGGQDLRGYGSAGEREESQDDGGRPIYVWRPSDATDRLPAQSLDSEREATDRDGSQ